LAPSVTFPKLKLVGFVVRLPGSAPVPESKIFTRLVVPALTRDKFPLALPTAVGLNTIWKLAFCCGAKVRGKVNPVLLKPEPVTTAWVIVTLELLVLAKTSVWLCAVPVCTLPKLRLAGAAASVPVTVKTWVEDFPTLIPWQPSIVARASKAGIAIQRLGVFVISDSLVL
jgi:hypothetical protein